MKQYLLGIDIGTSACKVAIFDKFGTVLASTNEVYNVYYPRKGYAEQNPDEWWSAVCKAIKEALSLSGIQSDEIAGIGIDGQSWSAIAVDQEGNVLTNTPIWMDTRANKICENLNADIGSEKIFDLAGNSLQPSYTTAKILWYKENMPEIYRKTDKILQSNSFIVYKLTGIMSQDKSQGYGLHCFDMHQGIWDIRMCEKLGIPIDILPDIYECHEIVGAVTKKAAEECGLSIGIPVVAGGLDAACGTLGAGVIHPGETQEQGGQAGGMSICTDTYKADKRLILSYHVVPDLWLLQGGTTGGGGVMRWIERELGDYEREKAKHEEKNLFELLNDIAEDVNPCCDGLVFLPYMAGERSPIWDPNAKGVFYGLDFSKTKGHLVRAAMEGVAFSIKHNLDVAAETDIKVDTLCAMGGSANSLLWTQIKSDIIGKPFIVPASDTATTLGACILAGVGVGMYKDFEEAVKLTVKVKRKHEPDMEKHEQYKKNYEIYLELYEKLKETMHK
ncbi:xylulokinase [Mobilisporobacter senegalensis]|uniref:Xylulose kinase n=1 Tax=Mobilisporobacter senegalensis TaxID=1329262 RepID=A0A3N1XVB0_9FIRM|nr:xylulokinase [Mobilisporobacter senegalensis]ROR30554.1 xylulokinase [Mobilisporobacter senegalensis]